MKNAFELIRVRKFIIVNLIGVKKNNNKYTTNSIKFLLPITYSTSHHYTNKQNGLKLYSMEDPWYNLLIYWHGPDPIVHRVTLHTGIP